MSRTDPYASFRFTVEIDSLIVGGFTEVSGLEREVETEEYNEGGVNGYTHSLPDRTSYPNLTLKRGLTDSDVFLDWLQQNGYTGVDRRSGRILLLDESRTAVWGWAFRDAYPVKWTGPDLRGDQGEVAIESVELTHRGLTMVEGLPR